VLWTVGLPRPVLGSLQLEVSYDLQAGPGQQLTVQAVQPLGLEKTETRPVAVPLVQVTGEVVVKKAASLSVTASPVGEGLEPVDVRELKVLPQQGALAFRYFKQPVALKLKPVKRETQPVVSTVVQRALVEVVVGLDQTAQYRCRYRLKSSERQRLALRLPTRLELLGVAIDGRRTEMEVAGGPATASAAGAEKAGQAADAGQAAEAERGGASESGRSGPSTAGGQTEGQSGWRTYLVNVTRSKSADEPFGLTLQFRTRLNEPFEGGRGELCLPLPQVGLPNSEDVLVQQTRVVVWVPPRVVLAGVPEGFTPGRPSLLAAVLGLAGLHGSGNVEAWVDVPSLSFVDFPTEGRSYQYRSLGQTEELVVSWWDVRFHTWVWTAAFVLVAWVLRTTSWENKLGVLLLVAVVAVLYAFQDVEAVLRWLQVARFGLAALVGFWLIHGLFGRRKVEPPAAQPKAPEPPVAKPTTEEGAAAPTPETREGAESAGGSSPGEQAGEERASESAGEGGEAEGAAGPGGPSEEKAGEASEPGEQGGPQGQGDQPSSGSPQSGS